MVRRRDKTCIAKCAIGYMRQYAQGLACDDAGVERWSPASDKRLSRILEHAASNCWFEVGIIVWLFYYLLSKISVSGTKPRRVGMLHEPIALEIVPERSTTGRDLLQGSSSFPQNLQLQCEHRSSCNTISLSQRLKGRLHVGGNRFKDV